MSARAIMWLVMVAAIVTCVTMLSFMIHGNLEVVRSITGHVRPGPGFWAFLGTACLLVILPALLSWGYFFAFQSGRITRISRFVDEIARDEDEHTAVVPLRISDDEAGRLSATFNAWRTRFMDEMKGYSKARAKLTRIDREKSEFLSIVSHELRTPLNTILGFSQLLIEGTEGDLSESQLEDMRIIQMSGKNLLGLINDILDLSAIESGTIQIHPGSVDVAKMAREVHMEFQGQLKGKKASLDLDIEPGPLLAHADPRRVYQIINNLVSNAVKFTPRGTVTLLARDRDGQVEVRVKDTGAGIPEEDLDSIFSEFSQSGTSTMRRKGTGLGLAICKKLVELHGGTISVSSVEGEGSTFTFTLPAARESVA
jgi:signal transduction histidine kinase